MKKKILIGIAAAAFVAICFGIFLLSGERDGACHRTDGKRKKPRRKNHVRRMDDQDR